MLLNFLFINLFCHVIIFAWKKIENTTYIYRLSVASLLFALIAGSADTYIYKDLVGITLYNNTLRVNEIVLAQETFITFLTLILLVTYNNYKFKPEFFLILFTNLASVCLILESYNFIILFISWELFSLTVYIMIIGNGVKKQEALAASMKYFLLSAFSTAFLLLGIAIIYHITGSIEYETVYLALDSHSIDLPVILIIFALLFKIGAAPLHFWAPDLYDAIPLPITAYVSNLPKLLYIFITSNLMALLVSQSNFFIIAGFLSLIVGTFGLTQQLKIKRFLAFSAIANVGYFLLIIKVPGLLFYNIVLYILPVLNVFIILMAATYYYEKEINGFDELLGFFKYNPFMSLCFAISIFSIAGIPPLPGFFAKYNLLVEAFETFPIYLLALIIITTVVAMASYLRILYLILFSKKIYTINIKERYTNLLATIIVTLNLIMLTVLTYLDILNMFLASVGY